MEFLRKYWTQIQAQLSQLTSTGMSVVVLVMVVFVLLLWLVLSYAATPDYVALAQVPADQQPQVVSRLKAEGIKVRLDGGQVMIPADQRVMAYAVLAQNELLAPDASQIFDDLVARQTPWATNKQNEQAYLAAKQKFLAQVIGKMKGVRSADVIISMPENSGFGQTYKRPSASVTVVTQPGQHVDKRLVGAIASWVRGSVAEMQPQDVQIVDANMGRPYSVASEDDVVPGETRDLIRQLEQDYTNKIHMALAYIPRVIVSVNVLLDPVLSEETQRTEYEASEPLRSEMTEETEHREVADAGEPGVRANTGAEITTGGGAISTDKTSRSETEFGEKPVTSLSHSRKVGHLPQRVSVTVNVPRSYFVQLYRQVNPQVEGDPDMAALQPIVDEHLAAIQSQVEPLVTAETDGVVRVHMIPDQMQLAAAAAAAPTTVGTLVSAPWTKPVALAGLAVVSIGLMLMMVRKSGQRPTLPSIEELAGIPPALPSEDDLVGEADASETTMPGIELDEKEIQQRRIAEQISEMIKANPREAAGLFGKWVPVDE